MAKDSMQQMVLKLVDYASMNVGVLVFMVTAFRYSYMREFWVQIGRVPFVYRYIGWATTVPS